MIATPISDLRFQISGLKYYGFQISDLRSEIGVQDSAYRPASVAWLKIGPATGSQVLRTSSIGSLEGETIIDGKSKGSFHWRVCAESPQGVSEAACCRGASYSVAGDHQDPRRGGSW
jgi:hypothetical protein